MMAYDRYLSEMKDEDGKKYGIMDKEARASLENIEKSVKSYIDNKTAFVTPEMYGAIGDGITDDSAAFFEAIAAAGVNGKIAIGNKTYNVKNANLTLLSGQILSGSGTLLQTIETSGNVITTATGVTIDGITIKQLNHCTGRGILASGDNVTIRNCKIFGKQIGIHGDNVYGNNVSICNNIITFSMYGIYLSVSKNEKRRTGLRICNNTVSLVEGFDSSITPSLNKALNIGGCSGAIVQGNILLGAAMDFCSYIWSDHIIYDGNVSDNYVSVIGDCCTVSNNTIDGDLRPEIYFPVSSAGMFCALEIVGNSCVVVNNIIRNQPGIAISENATSIVNSHSGISIIGNLIENCATRNDTGASISLIGVDNVVIKGNTIKNCGNIEKSYSGINIAGFKDRLIKNIVIDNNILDNCLQNYSLGACYIRYAEEVKINNNIISSVGRAMSLGVDGQIVKNVYISGNTIISGSDSLGFNDMYYTNELTLKNNDLQRAINGNNPYSLARQCKNVDNYGLVSSGNPQRGTFENGEIYPTTNGLKKCTKSGTFGITNIPSIYNDSVKATTTEGSNIIAVNKIGALWLCEGQYITVGESVVGAKIITINKNYDNDGAVVSANITVSVAAVSTVGETEVSYSNPTLADV